jgi:phenylalanyl-tRNA synthetase alpha chain
VTPAGELPEASRARLGIRDGEVNVLLRVILRDPHATLAGSRANELRDRIWAGLTVGRDGPPAGRAGPRTIAA